MASLNDCSTVQVFGFRCNSDSERTKLKIKQNNKMQTSKGESMDPINSPLDLPLLLQVTNQKFARIELVKSFTIAIRQHRHTNQLR